MTISRRSRVQLHNQLHRLVIVRGATTSAVEAREVAEVEVVGELKLKVKWQEKVKSRVSLQKR